MLIKLCAYQHPGYMLQDVGQSSVRRPTLVICAVLRCRGRSSEPEVGPLSGPPKAGYQQPPVLNIGACFNFCLVCTQRERNIFLNDLKIKSSQKVNPGKILWNEPSNLQHKNCIFIPPHQL